jgi:predicted small secreted protein
MTSIRLAPIVALIAVMALSACANTVRGVGRDVNATAQAVEDSVD